MKKIITLSCCSFSLNSMILLLFVPCFHTSINGFFCIFWYHPCTTKFFSSVNAIFLT